MAREIGIVISNAEVSSLKIRNKSDELRRMTNELRAAAENIPSWWTGDSRNRFLIKLNGLIQDMYNTADYAAGTSELISMTAKSFVDDEESLAREIGRRYKDGVF
ncbi:MAG: hypothetical protein FWD34_07760 [Oscillospiraceae bacterium]|nr:hypothetical protein [Oscillospiraceae bacterium]